MRRMGRIGVSSAIETIHGAIDHANIALVLILIFFFLVIRLCCRSERDGAAIRRPLRRSRAFRKIGELPRLPAIHRKNENLARLRLAVLFRCAHKREAFAVRRPTATRISGTSRDLTRRSSGRGHDPDRRVVTIMFGVDAHARIDNLRAIWRNLRISQPLERINIGRSDQPLFGGVQPQK